MPETQKFKTGTWAKELLHGILLLNRRHHRIRRPAVLLRREQALPCCFSRNSKPSDKSAMVRPQAIAGTEHSATV
jgi:hypothetical protein